MFQQTIISNQEKIKNTTYTKREYIFPTEILNLNKMVSFVGPRRAGKTYTMIQSIFQLIDEKKIEREQIVFIDCNQINPSTFSTEQLLKDYLSIYPDKTPFFILDEIQEVHEFTRQCFFLYNQGYKLFLSGSNAHLLSSELTTQFRGKIFEQRIYPLSRKEFLIFNNNIQQEYQSFSNEGAINNLFLEYCKYGGYPEISLIENKVIKENLILSYFELLLYKDLIERYKIENEYTIKYTIQKLMSSISKEFNLQKLHRDFTSQNIKLGIQTLYNYIEYLKNIFFINSMKQLGRKQGSIKYYLTDVCYLQFQNTDNVGKRLENMVFQKMIRSGLEPTFIINTEGEIDFYDEKNDQVIQVCRELTNENKEREIEPLLSSKSKNKILIVGQENTIKVDKEITIINAKKWLL